MFENHYHYSVGNRKTFFKQQAIIWATETGETLRYILPNWLRELPVHIEPQESLEQLCERRARAIRESNDRVRIYYSGGVDSGYMLDTFIKNNLHIDEIVMAKSGIAEADWEIESVAVPYVESLRTKIPQTKITILSPTMNDYMEWFKNAYWFENYTKLGKIYGFTALRLNRKLLSTSINDTGSKSANVFGLDKPFIHFVNGEWYTLTLDVSGDERQLDTSDNTFYAFYQDDPLIYTKQCHLLKRSIESNIPNKKDYNKVCFWHPKYQRLWNTSVNRVATEKKFIMKNLDSIPEYGAMNAKDSVAQKYMAENCPKIYKNFLEGIKNLNCISGGDWFNQGDSRYGDVGVFADFKSIDRNSTKTVDELYPHGFKLQ